MPRYCPESAPPGEKAVFAALQGSDDTDGWVALHSLGIADHVRQVEGEADFVVIVPGLGVLVIEVKSHRNVERLADGRWKLGNDAPTGRGPFQQASEAMYSIREFLEKKGVDLRSIPVMSAVWFTEVRARSSLPATPEWHDWQVLDSEDLRTDATSAILRTLALGTKHLGDKVRRFSHGGVGPAENVVERIVSVLRPRFEMATVAADVRRARESQLVSFLDEQYLGLDAMADNRAVLFTGPAGSGKTWLALEAARREIAGGSQGRLLCFNRFLGKRMGDDMSPLDGLTVGTLHQELLRISGVSVPSDASSAFWEQELPDKALEILLERPDLAEDFLIVDEIQDIANGAYLDVLDLLVKGGLSEGRVLLFGDFERQAIFESGDGRGALRQRIRHLNTYRLATNCRNLPRIGFQVNLLSKLDPGYHHFRRTDDGVDPKFIPYAEGADQSQLLTQAVRSLRDEGFELNEILVLSPLRKGSTAETTTDPWLRQILRAADGSRSTPGRLLHGTIQAHKGLEAPAVVVTDLDDRKVPGFESLLYVGLTRATDRLVAIVESRTVRRALGGNS